MYRQKPVKGGRAPVSSCMIKRAMQYVESDAKRFNVGKSFVIATIVCHHYRISEQEDYRTVNRKNR